MSSRAGTATDESTLSSYLNDHLAGSKAAIQLVGSIQGDNDGTPLGDLMARLATEIESDRDTLEGRRRGSGRLEPPHHRVPPFDKHPA